MRTIRSRTLPTGFWLTSTTSARRKSLTKIISRAPGRLRHGHRLLQSTATLVWHGKRSTSARTGRCRIAGHGDAPMGRRRRRSRTDSDDGGDRRGRGWEADGAGVDVDLGIARLGQREDDVGVVELGLFTREGTEDVAAAQQDDAGV